MPPLTVKTEENPPACLLWYTFWQKNFEFFILFTCTTGFTHISFNSHSFLACTYTNMHVYNLSCLLFLFFLCCTHGEAQGGGSLLKLEHVMWKIQWQSKAPHDKYLVFTEVEVTSWQVSSCAARSMCWQHSRCMEKTRTIHCTA